MSSPNEAGRCGRIPDECVDGLLSSEIVNDDHIDFASYIEGVSKLEDDEEEEEIVDETLEQSAIIHDVDETLERSASIKDHSELNDNDKTLSNHDEKKANKYLASCAVNQSPPDDDKVDFNDCGDDEDDDELSSIFNVSREEECDETEFDDDENDGVNNENDIDDDDAGPSSSRIKVLEPSSEINGDVVDAGLKDVSLNDEELNGGSDFGSTVKKRRISSVDSLSSPPPLPSRPPPPLPNFTDDNALHQFPDSYCDRSVNDADDSATASTSASFHAPTSDRKEQFHRPSETDENTPPSLLGISEVISRLQQQHREEQEEELENRVGEDLEKADDDVFASKMEAENAVDAAEDQDDEDRENRDPTSNRGMGIEGQESIDSATQMREKVMQGNLQ